ncbi:MAG: Serine/threonine-protein kinase pkn3, partial [Myxococcaceae bacterium]|nr:Serine/threonine-protein kinase pkn3 [Myxococcaceae bacterium]
MVAAGSAIRMDRLSPIHAVETVEALDEGAADELPAGTRFGRYEIRRLLGRGGFGAVYEARQLEPLQRPVALKVLHEIARTNPQVLARFLREAQIAASITHPHICTIFDIGSVGSVPYIAMERLHGEALDARLEREGALSPAATADALLPILSAVAAVHDAGIVHRDLKPANLFLATPRPGSVVPKLLDFGIVKVLDRDADVARTETRTFLGTPHYTSPEQAMDASAIDVRSDQWSLGVILYECLTGRRPWREGPVLQVLFEITTATVEPPSTRRADLSSTLDAVVMRALSRDPADRFASVRALGGALLPFASEAVRAAWRDEFLPHAA